MVSFKVNPLFASVENLLWTFLLRKVSPCLFTPSFFPETQDSIKPISVTQHKSVLVK